MQIAADPTNAARPVVERKVVVTEPRRDGFPAWALIPIGLLAVLLIFVMYLVLDRSNETNANIRVNTNSNAAREKAVTRQNVPTDSTSAPSTVTVPGPPPVPRSQSAVPGSQSMVSESPTKGEVTIQAKVVTKNRSTQTVTNERFYLLDQDVEIILSNAGIAPIEGQSLTNSLGLALVFPDQYGDFGRKAMTAINKHIKYVGQTDDSGSAQLRGVEPNSYYLFGRTKVGQGFSVWNSQVSIQVGDNVLTLTPQSVTEIQAPAGRSLPK